MKVSTTLSAARAASLSNEIERPRALNRRHREPDPDKFIANRNERAGSTGMNCDLAWSSCAMGAVVVHVAHYC